MQIRDEFIEYIKLVENGGKDGYESGVWSSHPSPEGGNDTIGYGHKLRNDEEWMKVGVLDEHIENLLLNDILKAARGAEQVVDEFDKISQNCQEMFTDFVFNLGTSGFRSFPKFIKAALTDDKEIKTKEYKRYYRNGYGEIKELEHRNAEIARMFL